MAPKPARRSKCAVNARRSLAAPLLPLVTEHVYLGLVGGDSGASVHLTDWPSSEQFPFDPELHAGMEQVRDACSTLLSLRKAEGLRVRLPLARAVVATSDAALLQPHIDILRDELNVKEVELTTDVDRYGSKELILNPAVQAKVASISDTCKKEIFDILKTPRPDGTNAADDLIKAFTSGDQQEAQKFFLKMFSDKIPGTETTYITAVARVQEKANQGLSAAMGTPTFERFKSMNIKPENIETGFDPWSEYLQQKGK